MHREMAMFLAWVGLTVSAAGQGASHEVGQSVVPGFDFSRSSFSHSGGMGFDAPGAGAVELSQFDIRSALSQPLVPADGMMLLPVAQYRATRLDFSGTPAGFPLDDMDLHALSLSLFFLRSCESFPWMVAGWSNVELATDFRHVTGDSFTYDLAAGVAYRFGERLVLGAGVAALNLNGDSRVLPGIGIDWSPTDAWRFGIYGPNFLVSCNVTPDWILSLQGNTAGDIWTVRSGGQTRAVDLSSYRVGLHADRRLTRQLWLSAGGGVTLGNELELTTVRGSRIAGGDLDNGWFAEIALRLLQW
jgi:hypothetical protein